MRFDLVSIFPDMLGEPFKHGVLGRAREHGLLEMRVHDLRDFADPPHRRVDDEPYGGGAGMLFAPLPWLRVVRALRRPGTRSAVVRLSPAGQVLTQELAGELSEFEQVVILCDRYEGSDERIAAFVSHEVSLGDYVMTGGELAALVLVDVVARLVPGVVGDSESVRLDSFSAGLLDHPQYTRPAELEGAEVPQVLRTGHHARIEAWRSRQALRRTLERRPDLLAAVPLGQREQDLLRRERAGSGTIAATWPGAGG